VLHSPNSLSGGLRSSIQLNRVPPGPHIVAAPKLSLSTMSNFLSLLSNPFQPGFLTTHTPKRWGEARGSKAPTGGARNALGGGAIRQFHCQACPFPPIQGPPNIGGESSDFKLLFLPKATKPVFSIGGPQTKKQTHKCPPPPHKRGSNTRGRKRGLFLPPTNPTLPFVFFQNPIISGDCRSISPKHQQVFHLEFLSRV
jgi:hypothetical protein